MSKTIEELIALAKTATPENPLPHDYADQVETAHLMSLESRDETIKQHEKTIAEQGGRISTYAIQNLELIRKAPAATPPEAEKKEPEKTAYQLREERRIAFEKKVSEL